MRVIIAGSRGCTDMQFVELAIKESGFEITTVVSGGAKGPDRLGAQWAVEHDISVKMYYANWNVHQRAAGMIRNAIMAENADALIAIWDGKSKGTAHMIKCARLRYLPSFVLNLSDAGHICSTV